MKRSPYKISSYFEMKNNKRKRNRNNNISNSLHSTNLNLSKWPAYGQRCPRQHTVSIALPGSIVANSQTEESKTYLAGLIARASAIYTIDEIVVFTDDVYNKDLSIDGPMLSIKRDDPNLILARLLQYLETPQYLRKLLYPMHSTLKYAGSLPPLEAPHHLKLQHTNALYREGVIVPQSFDITTSGFYELSKLNNKNEKSNFVFIGLSQLIKLNDLSLPMGTRVTLRMKDNQVVSPDEPKENLGIYWGFNVRIANGLHNVFDECPFGKYDLLIGTSERGDNIFDDNFKLQPSTHLLICFGGVNGLERSMEGDPKYSSFKQNKNHYDPKPLFHHYLNTCPFQGTRTIRCEEAIPISLAAIYPHLIRKENQPINLK